MSTIIKKIICCRICYSKEIKLKFSNNPSPIGEAFVKKKSQNITQKKYPLNVLQCNNCGLVQLQHVVNPNILYDSYLYETKTSYYLENHYRILAKKLINRFNLDRESFIVEIGSNDGTLLNNFKESRISILGVEPARKISKIANQKGIKTINDYFSSSLAKKISKKYGQADLIIANNVFANVHDVNNWMTGIKNLLKKNGIFVIETFYLLDLLKNKVFDFLYHEHLSAFSLKPINYLSNKYGLSFFDCEKFEHKGGSLRVFISKEKINKTRNFLRLKNEEIKFGIYKAKKFKELRNDLNIEKKKLQNFIKNNKDKSFFGLGASISCITLMYEFEIEKVFDLLIDDNKLKHNFFSPGSNIQIKSFNKCKFKKKTVVILLAWRFKKPLYKKYLKILKKKKITIIELWPKFKIV
jgi:SAM-dependent methyltransferase